MTDRERAAVSPLRPPEPLHVGVVTEGDEAVWIGVAGTRAGVVAHLLADFVLPRSAYQLGEECHRRFRSLLEEGRAEEAVELYFERVGERWDPQRLTVVARCVAAPGPASAPPRPAHLATGPV